MLTARVFWRRLRVLKSDTGQSRPVEASELQQAGDKPCFLPKCHPKEDFDREAGLNGRITIDRLAATFASGCGLPHHRRIEPNGQRSALFQRAVVVVPVCGLVDRLCRYAHAHRLPHWIRPVNPKQALRNKAL